MKKSLIILSLFTLLVTIFGCTTASDTNLSSSNETLVVKEEVNFDDVESYISEQNELIKEASDKNDVSICLNLRDTPPENLSDRVSAYVNYKMGEYYNGMPACGNSCIMEGHRREMQLAEDLKFKSNCIMTLSNVIVDLNVCSNAEDREERYFYTWGGAEIPLYSAKKQCYLHVAMNTNDKKICSLIEESQSMTGGEKISLNECWDKVYLNDVNNCEYSLNKPDCYTFFLGDRFPSFEVSDLSYDGNWRGVVSLANNLGYDFVVKRIMVGGVDYNYTNEVVLKKWGVSSFVFDHFSRIDFESPDCGTVRSAQTMKRDIVIDLVKLNYQDNEYIFSDEITTIKKTIISSCVSIDN